MQLEQSALIVVAKRSDGGKLRVTRPSWSDAIARATLSELDLRSSRSTACHIGNDLVLVAALGIDGNDDKHPPGLVEGATENTAVVRH